MPIVRRRCVATPSCNRLVWELLVLPRKEGGDVISALDHPDLDHHGCPTCGLEGERLVGQGVGIDLGGAAGASKEYPRWDHGLGCMVESRTHRRWLLTHWPDGTEREMKLRPTDGAFDAAAQADREAAEAAKDEKAYADMTREQEEGPNRAEYHRAKDFLASPDAAKFFDERSRR